MYPHGYLFTTVTATDDIRFEGEFKFNSIKGWFLMLWMIPLLLLLPRKATARSAPDLPLERTPVPDEPTKVRVVKTEDVVPKGRIIVSQHHELDLNRRLELSLSIEDKANDDEFLGEYGLVGIQDLSDKVVGVEIWLFDKEDFVRTISKSFYFPPYREDVNRIYPEALPWGQIEESVWLSDFLSLRVKNVLVSEKQHSLTLDIIVEKHNNDD